MKRFPTVVLLLLVAVGVTVLLLLISFNTRSSYKSLDLVYESVGIVQASHIRGIRANLNSRKLEERSCSVTDRKMKGSENVNLDDYRPVDPSPNSKATVKAGPIEHGTPLLPFVPRPTQPPGHPKHMSPAHSPASPIT